MDDLIFDSLRHITVAIVIIYRIITICKHIIAQDALAGRCEGIGINESADLGIVISALEIVERGLGFVVLAARAKMRLFQASKTVQSQHPRKPWNPKTPWLLLWIIRCVM